MLTENLTSWFPQALSAKKMLTGSVVSQGTCVNMRDFEIWNIDNWTMIFNSFENPDCFRCLKALSNCNERWCFSGKALECCQSRGCRFESRPHMAEINLFSRARSPGLLRTSVNEYQLSVAWVLDIVDILDMSLDLKYGSMSLRIGYCCTATRE